MVIINQGILNKTSTATSQLKVFNLFKGGKKILIFTIVGFLLSFAGCKTYVVLNSDYDRTTDFSSYKTYAWLPDKDNEETSLHNSIIHNNIKNYFSHHFAGLGYKADSRNPDLLFEQVVTSVTQTRKYSDQHATSNYSNSSYQRNQYYKPNPNPYNYNNSRGYNYNYNNRSYNNNYGYTSNRNYYSNNSSYRQQYSRPQYRNENHTEKYKESTFTLNAIDRKSNKLVWTCTVKGDIYDGLYIEKDIHPAVHTMLKTYPIKPMK